MMIDVEVTVKFKIESVISESDLISTDKSLYQVVTGLIEDEGIAGLMDFDSCEIVDIKKIKDN